MSPPVVKPADRARFVAAASPEAIQAHLRTARQRAADASDWVSWLEVLLARRCREVADGVWPPPRNPPDRQPL